MKTRVRFVALLMSTLMISAPAGANAARYMVYIFINSIEQEQSISIETGLATAPSRPCANIPSSQCCKTRSLPPSAPTPPAPDISAGYLAVDANGVSLGELKPPLPGKRYRTLFSLPGEGRRGGVQFHPGDVIRVRGSGGRIAAFDGKITTPPDLSGVRPALIIPPTSPLILRPSPPQVHAVQRTRIQLSRPIEIFWSPEAGNTQDTVRVYVTDFTRGAVVSCVAMDRIGHLLVQVPGPAPFVVGDKGALVITRNRVATPSRPSANATVVFNASYTMGGSVIFVDH